MNEFNLKFHTWNNWLPSQNNKSFHGQQNLLEWNKFVDRMIELNCETFLGIGVLHGGNQWNVACRYQELGKKCKMLAVDMVAHIRTVQLFDLINKEFPNIEVEFRLCDTLKLTTEELDGPWDACFIDGCHLYEAVRSDYELTKPIVKKMIGFHDINANNEQFGVQKLFREIRENHSLYEEFNETPKPYYGIGVVYNFKENNLLL